MEEKDFVTSIVFKGAYKITQKQLIQVVQGNIAWEDFELMLKVYADEEFIQVFYTDDEDEVLKMNSQEELEQAFLVAKRMNNTLHLTVNCTQSPLSPVRDSDFVDEFNIKHPPDILISEDCCQQVHADVKHQTVTMTTSKKAEFVKSSIVQENGVTGQELNKPILEPGYNVAIKEPETNEVQIVMETGETNDPSYDCLVAKETGEKQRVDKNAAAVKPDTDKMSDFEIENKTEVQQDARKYFYLIHKASNLVLDVKGASSAIGSKVILWPKKRNNQIIDNQLWYVDVETKAVCSKLNGLCLNASASKGDGASIAQYSSSMCDHLWQLEGDIIHHRYNPYWVLGTVPDAKVNPGCEIKACSVDSYKQRYLYEWNVEYYYNAHAPRKSQKPQSDYYSNLASELQYKTGAAACNQYKIPPPPPASCDVDSGKHPLQHKMAAAAPCNQYKMAPPHPLQHKVAAAVPCSQYIVPPQPASCDVDSGETEDFWFHNYNRGIIPLIPRRAPAIPPRNRYMPPSGRRVWAPEWFDNYMRKFKREFMDSTVMQALAKRGFDPYSDCVLPPNRTVETLRLKEQDANVVKHEGIMCDRCDRYITGVRYKCGNCADYDLCESCETVQGFHNPEHVFLKIYKPVHTAGRRKDWTLAPLLRNNIYKQEEMFEREYQKNLKIKAEWENKPKNAHLAQRVHKDPVEKLKKKHEKLKKKGEKIEEKIKRKEKRRLDGERELPQKKEKLEHPQFRTPDGMNAELVKDETFPDGTHVQPGTILVKKWQMRNTGTSPWAKGTKLVMIWGNIQPKEEEVDVPFTTAEEIAVITVTLKAPKEPGTYQSHWRMNYCGIRFGQRVWCSIVVDAKETLERPQLLVSNSEAIDEMDLKCLSLSGQSSKKIKNEEDKLRVTPIVDYMDLMNLATSPSNRVELDMTEAGSYRIEPKKSQTATPNNTPLESRDVTPPKSPVTISPQKDWSCGSSVELIDRDGSPINMEFSQNLVEERMASLEIKQEIDLESISTIDDDNLSTSDSDSDFFVVPIPDCFNPELPASTIASTILKIKKDDTQQSEQQPSVDQLLTASQKLETQPLLSTSVAEMECSQDFYTQALEAPSEGHYSSSYSYEELELALHNTEEEDEYRSADEALGYDFELQGQANDNNTGSESSKFVQPPSENERVYTGSIPPPEFDEELIIQENEPVHTHIGINEDTKLFQRQDVGDIMEKAGKISPQELLSVSKEAPSGLNSPMVLVQEGTTQTETGTNDVFNTESGSVEVDDEEVNRVELEEEQQTIAKEYDDYTESEVVEEESGKYLVEKATQSEQSQRTHDLASVLVNQAIGYATKATTSAYNTCKDVFHTLQARNQYVPKRSEWVPKENNYTPPAPQDWTPAVPHVQPNDADDWCLEDGEGYNPVSVPAPLVTTSQPTAGCTVNDHNNDNPDNVGRQHMEHLIEMGFANREQNTILLEKYNNDLERVVQELVSIAENDWYATRH